MLAEFSEHWIPYTCVVLLAALIGWTTKIAAIEMMFKPIEFRGFHIGPIPVGWQGIIPMRAAHMSSVATNKMITELISPSDVWDRIDPARLLAEIRQPLVESMDAITQETAATAAPELWGNMPAFVKDRVRQRIRERAPEAVENVMADVQNHVDELLDLKSMTTRTLVYDKTILQRVFRETGRREWAFIRRFGLVAGFFIGILQLFFYLLLNSPLVNPIMGAVNGWATDAFCIKVLLFNPKRPKKYFGIITWQGLFLKYQNETSDELAKLVTREVLSPHAIIETLLRGPRSDRFYLLIAKHVGGMLDEELGIARPMVRVAVGAENLERLQTIMAEKVMAALPDTMAHAEEYIAGALDLEAILAERLKELPPEEFEQVLRPAFQQDEWALIATGAILGAFAGFLQDVVIHLYAK